MCVNLGSIPGWVLSPVSLVKSATGAKSAGVLDYMDPTAYAAKKQDDKLRKEYEKEEKRRNDLILNGARQPDAASASPFTTYNTTREEL